ncbi:MAG: tetratricopeptide repeat protein, partial [Tepidisphaeraceae bacterium]
MVTIVPGKPMGLPPVWNVFQRRNIHFVGRQQNLQTLEDAFGAAHHRPQVLAGGGGCGKTALAIEYAYKNREKYDVVWWIRAESQATIAADLAALAPKLARSGQVFDGPRQACSAALEEL